ncbi:DUF1501 domain-containing protein [Nocardioides campestrisoli]|uniref:DUF1501 domain-containing protein n=1 Tax=Nocardioides campestrisoli TaxID=2736757 RepID=UPI0015E65C63|nr:DUF1501 domain-containing protein [Nocardioides campestrisoli]
MTAAEPRSCCAEYAAAGISRRGLLRAAGAAAALSTTSVFGSAVVSTSFAPPAFGAVRPAGRVLVVLSMRGAVDGMSLVVPHGDPAYYAARPRIGIPAERLLAKDGFFGLHPNLAPLLPLWESGRMASVHATGLAVPNRSHFAAMEAVEDADPGSRERVGWLNRLIARDAYDHPLRAVGVGTSTPPTSLYGARATSAYRDVKSMALAGADGDQGPRRRRSLQTMWGGVDGPLGASARSAMAAVADFGPVRAVPEQAQHGATYPRGDLASALAGVARTIRGDVGAEVFTVDHGDWDHHSDLGTLEWGSMQKMAGDFAQALAAFFTDLGPLADRVTVVTISEFGRRTRENANYGLDHGHGNVMLLLGAGVNGGYHGRWPGLTDSSDGDLLVTTDYRSVLAEVAAARLGASPAQTFPGFSPESVGAVSSL